MFDECTGLDILYNAFGVDILPKRKLQKKYREHRAMWREAKASGDPSRVRDTFFRIKRERFGLMDMKFQEEPMKTACDMGLGSRTGMIDAADVRVFFILSEGSRSIVSKIYIAFNVENNIWDPEMQEKMDKTTKWVLNRQVGPKMAERLLEMPCKLESAFRDGSGGEHLLQWSRNGDGSATLSDAWDCRRTIYVTEEGMRPGL